MTEAMTVTMKAIRFHQTGGPEVLGFEDLELGPPGPGEVRIRHTAVALNFRDILVRRGQHAAKLPSGLGSESAGVIEAIGPGVTGLEAGDAWLQPHSIKHKVLDYSSDCEVLEIVMPANFKTVELET